MSEKTYLSQHEDIKSYTNLNYLSLDQHETTWKKFIDTHPFNQTLTLFLPECSINTATQHLDMKLGHYYEIEAPLSLLLDTQFLEKYIKSDTCVLTMHSVGTDLNTDNVAVFSEGKLCLSLVKQTFETFGIEAIKRTKADIKHDKHIIVVDMKKQSFQPDSKEYNRLKWCLENTLKQQFRMIACATDSLTGTTIDIQWPTSHTHKITKHDIEPKLEAITDINIPTFSNIGHTLASKPIEGWEYEAMEAVEWLGLAHLKANRIKQSTKKVDPFISVYEPPQPLSDKHMGTLVTWTGIIPPSVIQSTMTILRKLMTSKVIPTWASLTFFGYKNSPYSWTQLQHYQYFNSENDLTFLLLPNNQTAYTFQLLGSHHNTTK